MKLTHLLLALTCTLGATTLTAIPFSARAAESFPDALLTTPGSPDVIQKGLEADGYALGLLAYTWGYPLVRMERVMRDYIDVPNPKPGTSYRAPLNQIGWAREVATPAAKDMPTANNDTAYMSSVVQLDEPFIFSVPDTQDRYYVVDVFNMWQELEHYIGRRATGTKAGSFALVPPGWQGELPAGVTRLDVTTDKVWLWGRIRVTQGESLDVVHQLQDQFTLVPLSRYGHPGTPTRPASLVPMPPINNDPLGFLQHLAFALQFNRVKPADAALFAQLSRIGLTEKGFDSAKLSARWQMDRLSPSPRSPPLLPNVPGGIGSRAWIALVLTMRCGHLSPGLTWAATGKRKPCIPSAIPIPPGNP
jgi:hypothetical protein